MAFYVLPQGSTSPQAVVLHRYYNSRLHFFTTNPTQDGEIIDGGKYTEDSAFYSKVLPLGAQGIALSNVYRWLLRPTDGDAWGGHTFGTEQDDPPAGAQNADGPQFIAFANGPADPFSRSAAASLAGTAAVGIASPAGVVGSVHYEGNAQQILTQAGQNSNVAAAQLQQACFVGVSNSPDLKQYADRYRQPSSIGVPLAEGWWTFTTAWVYVDTAQKYTEGSFLNRKTYWSATSVTVFNFT